MRLDKLKIAFNRVKDRQRLQQEDLKVISTQFKLIKETKDKYDIQDNNIYNFNKKLLDRRYQVYKSNYQL